MFPASFGLRPFVFDGVKIGRVRRQELQCVSCLEDEVLDVPPFVECGVVHHDHATGWQLGQQVLCGPALEGVRVDVAVEQPHGQQKAADHGPDDVGSPPRAPVADAIAAAPLQGVSVGARHVARKAALVDVNENPARRFIRRSLVLEDTPLFFAGFGVPKRFFYT